MSDILILVLLLILSGFFSSSETALFSISKTKARHLTKEGGKTFYLINRMKKDPDRLLSAILIGNNIVNVGAAALATSLTMRFSPHYAVGIATGVMTFLILVFGEFLPKSIAAHNNILIARIVIFPIYWISIFLSPVLKLFNFISRLTEKIRKTHAVTEEELMTFVEVVEEEGEIKEEERELIHNIFNFDDTSASEIMTPRADMLFIDVNEKLELKQVVESGFTRIPVIDGSIDNVVGIINIKDIFLHHATTSAEIDVRHVMRDPYFVPEHKKLDNLLHQFKKRKQHMAIVIDEHGGVSGLITLEDALEEIVGEIRDETDKEEPHIVEIKPNEWRVLGKADIEDVNARIGMEIPDAKEYDTFSGYILDLTGRIPKENEKLPIGAFMIIINRMEGNRIKEFIVQKNETL